MQALLCQPDALSVDDFIKFGLIDVFYSFLFHPDEVLEFQLVILFERSNKVINCHEIELALVDLESCFYFPLLFLSQI